MYLIFMCTMLLHSFYDPREIICTEEREGALLTPLLTANLLIRVQKIEDQRERKLFLL